MASLRRALFCALVIGILNAPNAYAIRRRRNESPSGVDVAYDAGFDTDAKDIDDDGVNWASNWMPLTFNDSDVESLNGDTVSPNSIQSSSADEIDESRSVETTTILTRASSSSSDVPPVGVIAPVGNGVRPPTTRSIVEASDPFNSALPLTELVVIGG